MFVLKFCTPSTSFSSGPVKLPEPRRASEPYLAPFQIGIASSQCPDATVEG